MKKRFNKLAGFMICILFAVFLLFIKDNMNYIWSGICNFASILTPFIYGFGIAYIMNFPYRFFSKKVFGKVRVKWFQKINKPLSLTLSYLLVFGVLALLMGALIPQLAENVSILVKNLPQYVESFKAWASNFVSWISRTYHIDVTFFDNINNEIVKAMNSLANLENVNIFANILGNTVTFFYNWIMAIVLSVYMLVAKDFLCNQLKRFAAAFLPTKWLPTLYEIINVSDDKCGKFLVGKIFEASFIGLMVFISMMIIGLPYASLISVIIAVCNLIPFFGPYIGGIPSAFLLLLVSPTNCIIFLILLFTIQTIDGNFIGPKIVGAQVGLIGFWSLFSVLVSGALFGIPGMILGTPIFAAIYTLLGRKVRKRIEMKGENAEKVIEMNVVDNRDITNIKAKGKRKSSLSVDSESSSNESDAE